MARDPDDNDDPDYDDIKNGAVAPESFIPPRVAAAPASVAALPEEQPAAPQPAAPTAPANPVIRGFDTPAAPAADTTPAAPEAAPAPVENFPAPAASAQPDPEPAVALDAAPPAAAPAPPDNDAVAREYQQFKANQLKYLKAQGVQTQVLPTGAEVPQTDDDGNHLYKEAVVNPLTRGDDGRAYSVVRDKYGNEKYQDILNEGEEGKDFHTDPQTGEQFVHVTGRREVIGQDPLVPKIADAQATAQNAGQTIAQANVTIAQAENGLPNAGAMRSASLADLRQEATSIGKDLKPLQQRLADISSYAPDGTEGMDASDLTEKRQVADQIRFKTDRLALVQGEVDGRDGVIADARQQKDAASQAGLTAKTSATIMQRVRDIGGVPAVQNDLETVANGGALPADRATALAKTGLLTQEANPDGSSIMRVSAAGVPMLTDDTQKGVAADPTKFVVSNQPSLPHVQAAGDAIAEATASGKTPTATTPKNYTVGDDGDLHFAPGNLSAGLAEAAQNGLMDPKKLADLLPQAQAADKAMADQQRIATENPAAWKAFVNGAGKGAAFLAGAAPGAAAGAEIGALGGPFDPVTIPAGSLIGGLIGGTVATHALSAAVDKLGQYNQTIKSFTDASQLHPYYDAAGNLVSFAAGLPKIAAQGLAAGAEALAGKAAQGSALGADAAGVTANLSRVRAAGNAAQAVDVAGNAINPSIWDKATSVLQGTAKNYQSASGVLGTIKNLSGLDAANKAAGMTGLGRAATIGTRVGGAAAFMVGVDTAIKEGSKALGINSEGQTLTGVAQAALVGAFAAGHNIELPPDVSSEQMANIVTRAGIRTAAGLNMSEGALPSEAIPPHLDVLTADALKRPLTEGEAKLANAFIDEVQRQQARGDIPANPTADQITDLLKRTRGKQALSGGKPIASAVTIDPAEETGNPPPGGNATATGARSPQTALSLPEKASPAAKTPGDDTSETPPAPTDGIPPVVQASEDGSVVPSDEPTTTRKTQPPAIAGITPDNGSGLGPEFEPPAPAGDNSKAPAQPEITLPRALSGAKPRYSYGSKQYQLSFASDLDKAAYTLAQSDPNKRHDDFLATTQRQTGLTTEQIVAHGQKVRAAIKAMAKDGDPTQGPLVVPKQDVAGFKNLTSSKTSDQDLPSKTAAPDVSGNTANASDQLGTGRTAATPATESSQPPAKESIASSGQDSTPDNLVKNQSSSDNLVKNQNLTKAEKADDSLTKKPEKRGSTQLTLSPKDAKPFQNFARSIPEGAIYSEKDAGGKEQYGRELEPHVTSLYGLTGGGDAPDAVARTVAGHGPVKMKVGTLSVFSHPDKPYDVLKADVDSPGLHELNGKLRALPHRSDFPDYHPHLTIAYVKKGEGARYVGKSPLGTREITADSLTHSSADRVKTEVPLRAPDGGDAITRDTAKATIQRLYGANVGYLRRQGISSADFEAQTSGESGLQFRDGKMEVDPGKFSRHLTTIRHNQRVLGLDATPEDAVHAALVEEGIHGLQNQIAKEAGFSGIHEHYSDAELPDAAFSRDWEAQGRAVRSDWDALPKWAKKAEYVRMLVQHQASGKITEALYQRAEPIMERLEELVKTGGVHPTLKAYIDRLARAFANTQTERQLEKEKPTQDDTKPAISETNPPGNGPNPPGDAGARPGRSFKMPSLPTGEDDALDLIARHGGIVTEKNARATGRVSDTAGDYDAAPTLGGFYHHAVYGGGMMPDRMAQILEGHGIGDGSTDGLWTAISQARAMRDTLREAKQRHAVAEAQADRFDRDAKQADTAKGETKLYPGNLSLGDQVQVGNQTLTVIGMDSESVELEDHSRYGLQTVPDGTPLYVEKVTPGPDGGAARDDAPAPVDAPSLRGAPDTLPTKPAPPPLPPASTASPGRSEPPTSPSPGSGEIQGPGRAAEVSSTDINTSRQPTTPQGKAAQKVINNLLAVQERDGWLNGQQAKAFKNAQRALNRDIYPPGGTAYRDAETAMAQARRVADEREQFVPQGDDDPAFVRMSPLGYGQPAEDEDGNYGVEPNADFAARSREENRQRALEARSAVATPAALEPAPPSPPPPSSPPRPSEPVPAAAPPVGQPAPARPRVAAPREAADTDQVASAREWLADQHAAGEHPSAEKTAGTQKVPIGVARQLMADQAQAERAAGVAPPALTKAELDQERATPARGKAPAPAPSASTPAADVAPKPDFRADQSVTFQGRRATVESVGGDHAVIRVHAGPAPGNPSVNLVAKRMRVLLKNLAAAQRQAASKATLPTLRNGEKQGDLLSKQTEDLTLAGETATDHAAQQVAQEQAAREAAEAKARQDREQAALFAAGVKPAVLANPINARAAQAAWKKLGVKSPMFQRWFGDWENNPGDASKAVDAQGKPLVLYHGSPALADGSGGFDAFHIPRDAGDLLAGTGVYLTDSKQMGQSYTLNRDDHLSGAPMDAARVPAATPVMSLYANIRKPFDAGTSSLENVRSIVSAELAKQPPEPPVRRRDGTLIQPPAAAERARAAVENSAAAYPQSDPLRAYKVLRDALSQEGVIQPAQHAAGDELRDVLQAHGYDGIRHEGGVQGGAKHNVWVAFHPEQAKSAEPAGSPRSNLGTFDAGKPSILAAAPAEPVDDGGTLSGDDDRAPQIQGGDRPEENRGAHGARPATAPESAADHLRASGASDPGSLPWDADVAGEAQAQAEALAEYAQAHGLVLSRGYIAGLRALLDRGAENQVRFSEDGQRVIKMTIPGEEGYGATPFVDRAGEIKLRKGTPLEYLNRLHLHNLAFRDDIRLEGIVRGAGRAVHIVTSQPFLRAAEPVPGGAATKVKPTPGEIAQYMEDRGFAGVAGTEGKTFYRFGAVPAAPGQPEIPGNLTVFDAHGGNFIKTAGGVLPIDLIPLHPDDPLLEALEKGLTSLGAAPAEPIFPSETEAPTDAAEASRATGAMSSFVGSITKRLAPLEHSDAIPATFDAARTRAGIMATQAGKAVHLDISNDQDREAATAVVEAGGDRTHLENDLARVKASPDKDLAEQYAPVYQHALDHLDRLTPLTANYQRIKARETSAAQNAGLPNVPWEPYVEQVLDDPKLGESLATDKGLGTNPGYRTNADAIAAGVAPVSMDLSDVAAHQVNRNRLAVHDKEFQDMLAGMKASDGQPLLSSIEENSTSFNKNGDVKSSAKLPKGYDSVQAGNSVLVIHKEYAPLVKSLYGQSLFDTNKALRVLKEAAAFAKHGTVGIGDTYHLCRTAARAILGFQTVDYRKGLAGLNYAPGDLDRAVAAGEITQAAADDARENAHITQIGLQTGFNAGKVSDNMMGQLEKSGLFQRIPILAPAVSKLNHFIFERFQRGIAQQCYVTAFKRLQTQNPGASELVNGRQASKEVNAWFGNLGNQGVLKSKTLQDMARLVMLAPQFAEGLFTSEARGIGQAARIPVDLARGRGLRVGNIARAMGGVILASLIGNQLLNLFTKGKPTWENEDGHKWDGWIPGGPNNRGFYFSPLSIAAEYTHAMLKYMEGGASALDAAIHVGENKLGPLARGAQDLLTGKDYAGRPFASTGERLKAAAVDAAPSPLPLSGFLEKNPGSTFGYRYNRQTGALEKQSLSMIGLKVDAAQSARTKMFQAAAPFRAGGAAGAGSAHPPSAYSDLRHMLDGEDADGARAEIGRLVGVGHKLPQIAHAFGIQADGRLHPELYTGGKATEAQMMRAFTPEQRKTYYAAQKEHAQLAQRFRRAAAGNLQAVAREEDAGSQRT